MDTNEVTCKFCGYFCLNYSLEHKIDKATAGPNNVVFTIDYAQNFTLPTVPDTPSGWYFLSLVSVSLFGIYCANDRLNYNFCTAKDLAEKDRTRLPLCYT